jgi:D-serine deaminase-like pyridoxal phosphate-dependent protein
MNHVPPLIGCSVNEISTPFLSLDLDLFESNIQAMVATCRQHGIQWRPHSKCHKSPVIAQKLLDAGADGITCATIREAEVMANAGIRDLLIANLIAGPAKIQRLAALATQSDVIVCVDHVDQAVALSTVMDQNNVTIRVLVELEIGMNRVGILPDDEAVDLARQIEQLPGLQLAGLMAYEGHLLTIKTLPDKQSAIATAIGQVTALKERLLSAGLPCPIVSCGGTGSYPVTVQQPGITEIQAGGAIFMDAFYRQACSITDLQHALTIQTTVVSLPTHDRAIIDAGHKAMNMTIHNPHIRDRADLTIAWLSAEHGAITRSPDGASLSIGQQLELIPGYGDLTNMLHPYFHGFRNSQLEQLIPIVR